MNALRHVQQLIRPGGAMIDLHPVSEERVESAGRMIGVIADPKFTGVDLPNAEARLAEVVREKLYVLEAEEQFEVHEHFDETEELLEARHELLADQPELARRLAAATPPLVAIMAMVLRRFEVPSETKSGA